MPNDTVKQFDVCIIGGGIVGLTLAALLSETDLSIAIVEPSAPPAKLKPGEYALRVSAINLASMRIFQHLGFAQALLDERASGYHAMQIWDANSNANIQFNADDIEHDYLGYIIENDIIINNLLNILKVNKNVISYTDALQSLEYQADGIKIGLTKSSLQTQLLIGADGQHSKVRTLANFPTEMGTFNQTAMVCRIQTELPHHQTAYQCFHHSGPIAYLPLADGSSSIVWSCDSDEANRLKQLDDKAFADSVQNALQSKLGGVEILSPRGAFELAQQHASAYFDSRIALVGDAAHRTHPLAGLGANLGLQDAAVLAEAIQLALKQHRTFYGTAVLRKYERIRKHQNALVLDAMQAFKTGFASSSTTLTSLRALALNSADKLFLLKNIISQLATGDAGDLPEICQAARYIKH
jgi:2-octaprenylphenol hydroxylase